MTFSIWTSYSLHIKSKQVADASRFKMRLCCQYAISVCHTDICQPCNCYKILLCKLHVSHIYVLVLSDESEYLILQPYTNYNTNYGTQASKISALTIIL